MSHPLLEPATFLSVVTDLSRALAGFPDRLHTLRTRVADTKRRSRMTKDVITDRESEVMLVVQGEVKPGTGGAAFTNETSRKAEVRRRLADDVHHSAARKSMDLDEAAVTDAELDLQRAEDEHKATAERAALLGKAADFMVACDWRRIAEIRRDNPALNETIVDAIRRYIAEQSTAPTPGVP